MEENKQGQPLDNTPTAVSQVQSETTSQPIASSPSISEPQQTTSDAPKVTPQTESKSNMKYIITGIVLILVVLAAVYFFITKSAQQPLTMARPVQQAKTPSQKPVTSVTPVTAANVNQTLSTANNTINQAVTQANTDLNSAKNINTSQDSTAGL